MKYILLLISMLSFSSLLKSQDFLTGADLSYINEMEDCGAIYKEGNIEKDPYQIFADHNCNLVRLRLWHTPSWYDDLNNGNRYGDLADVKKSMQRAKDANLPVLLDFHLSDTWADPGKQIIPAAWSGVVDDLDLLKDSLYHYIYSSLEALHAEGLVPEIVQIGNEVNRGILQSEEANQAGWALDWERNGVLFNRAIDAVRDFQGSTGSLIKIALHISGPDDANWYFQNFFLQNVVDFEYIGVSYYTQWHGDLSFTQVAEKITQLKADYNREVILMEVGYPWTSTNVDAANNILTNTHPDFTPFSPTQQKNYLKQLATTAKNAGAIGMVYWEPAWVSTSCSTPWGQGSHYDNATFFDSDNNLIADGGIQWMQNISVSTDEASANEEWKINLREGHQTLDIKTTYPPETDRILKAQLTSIDGRLLDLQTINPTDSTISIQLPKVAHGNYIFSILSNEKVLWSKSFFIAQ